MLDRVEQLVDIGQTHAIAWIIHFYYQNYCQNTPNLITGIEAVYAEIEKHGLDVLTQVKLGNLALPRLQEVVAAINRIRY